MFDRTLPRLVALALGVLVLLKLVFPEPPFETKKKEEKDEAKTKKSGEEAKPAESAKDNGADAGVAQEEAEPVAAEKRRTEEPVADSRTEAPSREESIEEAPLGSPPGEPIEAPPPEVVEEPSPVEGERPVPPTEAMREEEPRPPEAAAAPSRPPTDAKGIIDTAAASGSLSAFGMTLELTRLDALLRLQGPFTVFAPTDRAFAELEMLDQLMDDTERLAWVLKNHIVRGHYMAADLAAVATLDAISGARLNIDTSDDIKVENASVVEPDILANNGVIHAINKVLVRSR
jgi:uncharacterized surface protein with fasciclin (FAS1) repeats